MLYRVLECSVYSQHPLSVPLTPLSLAEQMQLNELLAKPASDHVTGEDVACTADFQLVPPGTMADRRDDEKSFDHDGKKACRSSGSGYNAPGLKSSMEVRRWCTYVSPGAQSCRADSWNRDSQTWILGAARSLTLAC